MIEQNIDKQLAVIKRGAVEIYSDEELKKKISSSIEKNKPLIVKAGFDPTAPDIHLGHTVLLRKMRQFQELGHQVVFLIGDFTGRIGDPSGRNELRKQLSVEDVLANAQTYKQQVAKVLDIDTLKIAFNSSWFDTMQGLEFGRLLTHYTATRLLERDDFSRRIKSQKPIYLSEFIYPVLQGYDSVMLNADVELGGTDQIFNLLVGRELQRDFKQEPQVVMTMPLLEGTDGVAKMSKSSGNYIGISEGAQEMFGKIMSISDSLMMKYYELLTDDDLTAVAALHPKEAKVRLARLIVSCYHSSAEADKAASEFQRVFSDKGQPEDIPEYETTGGQTILQVLVDSGLIPSGNEARRLIKQASVSCNAVKITDVDTRINENSDLKVGARRFLRVIIKPK